MRRTFIIGDIHGCLEELESLLELLAVTENDSVVCVGDLVGKGPNSVGVVRHLREIGARSVLGNHDANLLEFVQGKNKQERPVHETIRKAAKKLRDDELEWIAALPLTLPLPEHRAIVVHGGIMPSTPIEAQPPGQLMTLRSIRDDGSPSKKVDDGVPWASQWPGPTHVYFGHDAIRGMQRHPHATGLDTGCVYGGRLTAIALPEREVIAIPATKTWATPSKSFSAANPSPAQSGKPH